ncbi:efflux RND transporter permease subunit [Halopseudomonas pachastrellae]|nr:efflux RND transporter permease subunit [Halopseudomonas pachastrellae]
MSKALIEATVLVIVLLALFLGNVRAALTVALVLPLAALITFILMRFVGMSANLMSLGGLAIAIGMLVDARWWWSRTSSSVWPPILRWQAGRVCTSSTGRCARSRYR